MPELVRIADPANWKDFNFKTALSLPNRGLGQGDQHKPMFFLYKRLVRIADPANWRDFNCIAVPNRRHGRGC